MSNVDPSAPGAHAGGAGQGDETPDLFKMPVDDIEGLESFGEDAESTPPPPPPPPPVSPSPASRQQGPAPAAAPRSSSAPRAASRRAPSRKKRKRRSFSVFWPVILIMGGVLLLLKNLGYLPDIDWGSLWRLWPLALIALGIDTLFSRRSTAGSIIGALLILGLLVGAFYVVSNASDLPWMSQWVQETSWQSKEISHPLSGVERARVVVDWNSVPLQMDALDDSSDLIAGTVVYRGRLNYGKVQGRTTTITLRADSFGAGWPPSDVDGREPRWALGLSPRVPIDLELDGGSGRAEVDLRDLELEALGLDVASGAVDLYVPRGEYKTWIDGGSGSLNLWVPERAGVRIVVDDGSGSLRLGDRFRLVEGERDGDGVWETDDVRQADELLSIRLDVGSGTVRVRDWE